MRPWILDPELAAKHLSDDRVPDSVRGSISRMMVADRTGLSRETVRRRIVELTEKGLIALDDRGFVRLPGHRVVTPEYQQTAADIYAAVIRYHRRIADLGVAPPA